MIRMLTNARVIARVMSSGGAAARPFDELRASDSMTLGQRGWSAMLRDWQDGSLLSLPSAGQRARAQPILERQGSHTLDPSDAGSRGRRAGVDGPKRPNAPRWRGRLFATPPERPGRSPAGCGAERHAFTSPSLYASLWRVKATRGEQSGLRA